MSVNCIYFRKWKGEFIKKNSFKYDKDNQPLVDFLNEKAKECIDGRVSTIKTIYTNENTFIGYYSIAMSHIESKELYDEKRVATFPHPAIKLARLLIDKNYRNKKIGSATIDHIVMTAQKLNEFAACRFVGVDAKPEALGFYKKKGFIEIPNSKRRKKEYVPMLFDLKDS